MSVSTAPRAPSTTSRTRAGVSALGRARRRLRRWPWLPVTIILVVLVLPAIFAEWIAPHDPLEASLVARLKPPVWVEGGTWEYLLGTDKQGRDLLTRIIYGARISLPGLAGGRHARAVAIGRGAGPGLGLLRRLGRHRHHRGWSTSPSSLPLVLIGLVLVIVMGPGLTTVVASSRCCSGRGTRARSAARRWRSASQDYIARATGRRASDARIIAAARLPERRQHADRAGDAAASGR